MKHTEMAAILGTAFLLATIFVQTTASSLLPSVGTFVVRTQVVANAR